PRAEGGRDEVGVVRPPRPRGVSAGTRAMPDPRPAVFLDRDGVLNRCYARGGVTRPPADVGELEILPGVPEALARLRDAGFPLVDRWSDVAAGQSAGCRAVLVVTPDSGRERCRPDHCAADMAEAAAWILTQAAGGGGGNLSLEAT